MANLSSKAAQSYHAASSVCKELINLAAADPRGVRVVSCEAEDAQVSDVYSFLGSKSRLVDPVLHGDHATVCCVGSSALGLQLLVDVFRAAASDMMSGAGKIASERLLRLGVSLLECHEDSGLSWKDAISEKAIDPFMLDDNAFVCTSQPLQQNLEVVEECIQRKAAAASSSNAGSRHFAFELSAAHANEMGALTVVFLTLPATAVEPLESQSLDSLWQYASTLRSVGEVLGKPRTGFGLQPAHPNSRNGLILMLMPKNIVGGEQSLASHFAAECAKLVEDAAMGSEKEVRKMSVVPALAAYKMQQPTRDIGWGVLDGADVSEAAGSGTTEAAQIPSTQQSQPPQPSQSSYVPVTPRASISVWQKIAELDSFDVEAWCRDMQQHGRSSSDQITELSKIVTQFQDLLRFLASQVLPGNHGHSGPSSSFGSHSLQTNGEILRESRDSMVSPRLGASPYTTSSRQVLPAHGTHTLASTGNLVALSPRNPAERRGGESLSSSPLTRSCSANYPVGSVLPQKGNSWSGFREVQSPKTVTRDLSPAELRMLNATPQPHPGVQGHAAQPSPWQSTLMSVPSTALLAQLQSAPQDGHIMRSPRTEQGRERGDGQRSPLPRPPQFAKAHPHSARAAPSGMIFVPGQPVPRPHPMRSAEMTGGLRWEPSPFRVRFMSASQPQVQLAPSSAGAMGSSAPPGRLGAQVMPHSHHVAVGHHVGVGDLRPSPVMSPAKIV